MTNVWLNRYFMSLTWPEGVLGRRAQQRQLQAPSGAVGIPNDSGESMSSVEVA